MDIPGIPEQIFESIIVQMVQYWYISIFIGLALVLANRITYKITICLIGFYIGMFQLYPYLKNFFSFSFDGQWELLISMVIGLVAAIAAYSLFHFIVTLAGFIVGGLLGAWLWNIVYPFFMDYLPQTQTTIQTPGAVIDPMTQSATETITQIMTAPVFWPQWIFIGFFAVVVGVMVMVSLGKSISLVSIFLGAAVLSALAVYGLAQLGVSFLGKFVIPGIDLDPGKIEIEPSEPGVVIFIVIFVALVACGFFVGRPGKGKKMAVPKGN